MHSFDIHHKVPFSAQQMFDLVADVESYPQFLPYCQALNITETSIGPQGQKVVLARMQIGYNALHETFTTRVTFYPEEMRILVEYIDGPFSRLENRWHFRDIGVDEARDPVAQGSPSCAEVDFFIEYQFKNRLVEMLVGAAFDRAFRMCVDAFESRAQQVYGKGNEVV